MAGKTNGKTGKITSKREKDKKEFAGSKMSVEGTKAAGADGTGPKNPPAYVPDSRHDEAGFAFVRETLAAIAEREAADGTATTTVSTGPADAPEAAPAADEQKSPGPEAAPAERTMITGEHVLEILRAKGMKI